MLLVRPPKEPAGFDDRTREARAAVQAAVDAGEKPDFDARPAWQERPFKAALSRAQHRKCAYCEHKTQAGEPGAVDHFRPKSNITRLGDDPATWGREIEDLPNYTGRKLHTCSDRGYWWLAYEWKNLRLACNRCNSWKGSLFPVIDRMDGKAPDPDTQEVALLLDPFGEEDPAEHLQFDDSGFIEARDGSVQGFESIRTLGLDRETLRDARSEKAKGAFRKAHRLMKATMETFAEELEALLEHGRADRSYAGMVRIIACQETGLTWAELESLRRTSPSP